MIETTVTLRGTGVGKKQVGTSGKKGGGKRGENEGG